MNHQKLPEIVKEVLVKLQDQDFILTGSYALQLYGLLDRDPKDLDIISNSPVVLDKLRQFSLDMSPVFESITQERFLYQSKGSELYIDMFPATKNYEYMTTMWDGLKLKILKPKDIYLIKLEEFYELPKTKNDLVSYFKHVNNR